MLAGMIVTHHGHPKVVRNIQAPAAGHLPTPPDAVVYTLQPPDGGQLTFLKGPRAEDIPLLAACPECGPDAQPGQYGSPGWACRPGCSMGPAQRAALLDQR